MKVERVYIQNFKRFTALSIIGIPETAKMVVLVGPNGCGKTSVFEAFNSLYKGFCAPKNQKHFTDFPSAHIFNNRQIYTYPDLYNSHDFQDESNNNYCKKNDCDNKVAISIYRKSLINWG